jgi:WD40 repeat protein
MDVHQFSQLSSRQRIQCLNQYFHLLSTKELYQIQSLLQQLLPKPSIELPEEVLIHIFRYLDTPTLAVASTVCQTWARLLKYENTLWKDLCLVQKYQPLKKRKLPPLPSLVCPEWKRIYKQCVLTSKNWRKGQYRLESKRGSEGHLYVAFDERFAASIQMGQEGTFWDWSSGEELFRLEGNMTIVKFNEKYIVTGSVDRTIKVWDAHTRRCLKTLRGHVKEVTALQFNDQEIVSGSEDCSLRVSFGLPDA